VRRKIESDPRHIFINQLIVPHFTGIKVQDIVVYLIRLGNDIRCDTFVNHLIDFFREMSPNKFKIFSIVELSSE
jgi:hypothetical protein